MRVVIDTNCLVSALLFSSGSLKWLREAWQNGNIIPLISRATMDELLRVLQYPKFKLTPQEIEHLLADFLPWAQVAEVQQTPSQLPKLSDPDNVKFLALAVIAKAEVLVSGDKDILAVKDKLKNISVLTMAEFKRRLS
jgi:putative PIN family toxin of toxin-antitoxin system